MTAGAGRLARLPVFYGWVLVATALVTMGVAVNAGTAFSLFNLASSAGAGLGPWVTGIVHDGTGSYAPAFWLAIACSIVSIAAIWLAAPRHVRRVAGRSPRPAPLDTALPTEGTEG